MGNRFWEKGRDLLIFFLIYTSAFFLIATTLPYTFPFFCGFLLALPIRPLVRTFKNRLHCKPGMASVLSTALVYFFIFSLLFLLGFWTTVEVAAILRNLSALDPSLFAQPILHFWSAVERYAGQIDADFVRQNQEQILSAMKAGLGIATALLTGILRFLTSIPAVLTTLFVMIFSTYFFSRELDKIQQRFLSLFSKNAAANLRKAAGHGISLAGKYLLSYFLLCFLTFLLTLCLFFILGIPYPLVLSLLAGILDVIPVFGPGAVYLSLSIGMLASGKVPAAVALIAGWLLITLVRQILEPKAVSTFIHIHPLWMLASFYFSLVSGNFFIFLYFLFLAITYQILVKSGILPSFFKDPK